MAISGCTSCTARSDKPLVADLPDHSRLSPGSASMNDRKGPPVDHNRAFDAFAMRLL
jgi:hypothetical protein